MGSRIKRGFGVKVLLAVIMGGLVLSAASAYAAKAAPVKSPAPKLPFLVRGSYLEGCSCSAPCPCDLVGPAKTCEGIGAFEFDSGRYGTVGLAGVKVAYAGSGGKWVRVYIDAKNEKQRKAAEAFLRAAEGAFGPIESVKAAKITITRRGYKYTLRVDNGKVMVLTTEPILGGDGKTPLVYSNTHDPVHPTVMQGKTISGKYHDGNRTIDLKGTNAYFNTRLASSGKL